MESRSGGRSRNSNCYRGMEDPPNLEIKKNIAGATTTKKKRPKETYSRVGGAMRASNLKDTKVSPKNRRDSCYANIEEYDHQGLAKKRTKVGKIQKKNNAFFDIKGWGK